jgi:acyl carrier protein
MTVPESHSGLDQIRARLEQILFGVFAEDNREEAPGEIPQDLPVLELGISSLALVEGMRQVYEQFGVLISIRRVIEAQVSLTGLALMIEQELSTRQFQKKTPASAQAQSKPIQLRRVAIAPAQQHVAFLSRYSNQANAAFNETVLVRLEGALDGPALYTAIEEAVQRTEALRSALSQDSDELVITTGQSLELKTSQVSPDDLERKIAELALQPFDPGEILFRVELLRLSQDEHLLALVGHTLVIDYQALVLVLDEIAGLYQHYRQEETPPPPSPNIQSSDFLAMVNTGIAREAYEKARPYWQGIFTGDIPKLDLPTDHTRPAIKQYSGARLAVPLEPQLETDLRAWAAAHKTPVQQIIFAAFSLLLHRLSGQRELVIGYESELLDLEAGFRAFARTRNLLALRRKVEPQSSFLQYLQSQSAMLAEAHKHRNFSLAELIQVVQTQRDQSRSALFTASFRALDHDLHPIFDGLKTEILIAPGSGARYDLELILHNSPHGAQLVCDYSVELFEPHTIQRWLEGL